MCVKFLCSVQRGFPAAGKEKFGTGMEMITDKPTGGGIKDKKTQCKCPNDHSRHTAATDKPKVAMAAMRRENLIKLGS
jgi:hypothetical protein